MTAYYNEIDPYAAQWLRNLIAAGHIAPGDVDERSIVNVRADELAGYTQCHFFAGIGGWSLALRLAGWDDDRHVWTGSCPCQPFSAAGKGQAADDERHLWPSWLPLIAECRPPVVFGEQVEAAVGWGWVDAVFSDLEQEGYACGTAVLPACGVGAPHIRQRLWFVANSDSKPIRGRPGGDGSQTPEVRQIAKQRERLWANDSTDSATSELADACKQRRDGEYPLLRRRGPQQDCPEIARRGTACELADAAGGREAAAQQPRRLRGVEQSGLPSELDHATGEGLSERPGRALRGREARSIIERSGDPHPSWSAIDWLPCTDGKARPVEPGTFPLAHGVPGRVGRLRAYGNAIVPQVAAEFIKALAQAEEKDV